jgi:putative endonuclease
MACKRSAVRSRLAPPAFACFASYGSASHAAVHRSEASEGCRVVARRAKTGLGKPGRHVVAFAAKRGSAMKYVYILESLDSQHFYVGITDDLRSRLAKHNAGEVAHTSKYRPWRIKTYVAFSDEARAIAFEKYLKSGSGRAFASKRL